MEFFWLIFAHCLADFPLQGEWLAKNKGKEPLFMSAHVVLWTGCIALALTLLGIDVTWWKALFLFGGHYLADHYKCVLLDSKYESQFIQFYREKGIYLDEYQVKRTLQRRTRTLVYLDQFIHLIQLLIVYFL